MRRIWHGLWANWHLWRMARCDGAAATRNGWRAVYHMYARGRE